VSVVGVVVIFAVCLINIIIVIRIIIIIKIIELGRRTSSCTDDPRETSFLLHHLSVAAQRFNVVTYSFGLTQFEAARRPNHIEAHHSLIRLHYLLNVSALGNCILPRALWCSG